MAFANNVVLLSDTWKGIAEDIKMVEAFCQLSSLPVQVKKTHGFFICPTHDSYVVNNCKPWMIGLDLNMISPGETGKYLGLTIDAWTGTHQAESVNKLDH